MGILRELSDKHCSHGMFGPDCNGVVRSCPRPLLLVLLAILLVVNCPSLTQEAESRRGFHPLVMLTEFNPLDDGGGVRFAHFRLYENGTVIT
jgi:hypothetical protein